jgi:hypothetical protein
MKSSFNRNFVFIVSIVSLVGASLACNFSGSSNTSNGEATAQALSQSVSNTATAEANQQSNVQGAVEDASANATATQAGLQATQTAKADAAAQDISGTQTAVAPFLQELAWYGLDPTQGKVGFIHPPLTLEVSGYKQYTYGNDFAGTVANDFAMASDITWSTKYGSAGCGFAVRSDGNDTGGDQYLIMLTRGASGHVNFAVMAKGEVVTAQDFFPQDNDPLFSWDNGSTNRLSVVGIGNAFNIYTNGNLVGVGNPDYQPIKPPYPGKPKAPPPGSDVSVVASYQAELRDYQAAKKKIDDEYAYRLNLFKNSNRHFDQGFVAMVAGNESGDTSCLFENTWLWLVNP